MKRYVSVKQNGNWNFTCIHCFWEIFPLYNCLIGLRVASNCFCSTTYYPFNHLHTCMYYEILLLCCWWQNGGAAPYFSLWLSGVKVLDIVKQHIMPFSCNIIWFVFYLWQNGGHVRYWRIPLLPFRSCKMYVRFIYLQIFLKWMKFFIR